MHDSSSHNIRNMIMSFAESLFDIFFNNQNIYVPLLSLLTTTALTLMSVLSHYCCYYRTIVIFLIQSRPT